MKSTHLLIHNARRHAKSWLVAYIQVKSGVVAISYNNEAMLISY